MPVVNAAVAVTPVTMEDECYTVNVGNEENANFLWIARDVTTYDYYGGQKIGRDYANLAPQVPPQYASPFVKLAKGKLSQALISCVVAVRPMF